MEPEAIATIVEIGRDLSLTTLLIALLVAIQRGELVTKGHHKEVRELLEARLERALNGE